MLRAVLAVVLAAALIGVATPAIDDARADRLGPDAPTDWLLVKLRVALARAREQPRARPPGGPVDRSATATQQVTRQVVSTAAEEAATASVDAVERRFGRDLARPPAGLPLAPVPGYSYVTTNVWTVTVRGEYLRFAVSVPSGPPGRSLTYERQRAPVRVDWDDDGRAERLGRSTRLSFAVSTAAVVVVPPGSRGVGDRDGDAVETSAGWPRPGNASGQVTTTSSSGL